MITAKWVLRHEDTIPLQAQPKERARTIRLKNGKIRTHTPEKTKIFEQAVARWIAGAFTLRQKPLTTGTEPVRLDVLCVFARPQRLCRRSDPDGYLWRAYKPDASNLLKSIEDGIEKAQCIVKNDSKFVDVRIQKVFGGKEQSPEIKVWIYTLEDEK